MQDQSQRGSDKAAPATSNAGAAAGSATATPVSPATAYAQAAAYNWQHAAEVDEFNTLTDHACVDPYGQLQVGAVREWQSKRGLRVTGMIDRDTLGAPRQAASTKAQAPIGPAPSTMGAREYATSPAAEAHVPATATARARQRRPRWERTSTRQATRAAPQQARAQKCKLPIEKISTPNRLTRSTDWLTCESKPPR